MLITHPTLLSSEADRTRLAEAMRILSNVDIMRADESAGVLFTEDYTDLNILRESAHVLGHPLYEPLLKTIMCKSTVTEHRDGAAGISAKDYYDKLTLVRADLPGVFLVDGNAHPHIQPTAITGSGLQRLRGGDTRLRVICSIRKPWRGTWPKIGPGAAAVHVAELRKHLEENYPPAFLREPLKDASF